MEEAKENKDTIITLSSTDELARFLEDNPGKIVSVIIQFAEDNADAERNV
jgi:hypothetical protein